MRWQLRFLQILSHNRSAFYVDHRGLNAAAATANTTFEQHLGSDGNLRRGHGSRRSRGNHLPHHFTLLAITNLIASGLNITNTAAAAARAGASFAAATRNGHGAIARTHHAVDPADAGAEAAVDAHVLVDEVAIVAADHFVRLAQQEAGDVLHVLIHVDDHFVLLVVVHQMDGDDLDVDPIERNGLEDLKRRELEFMTVRFK